MLALVVSDIHGRVANLERIIEFIHNRKIDLVLVLGDLTNLGGKKEAEEALKPLKGFEVAAMAGNFETAAVQKALEEKGISLHAKKKKVGKWFLVGFGGGLIGDPGKFLFSEEEMGKSLLRLMRDEKNVVLLTHLPPFGTKIDLAHTGAHIGSRAVKEVVEAEQPALHLCGHCHEGVGEQRIGKTVSINIGAVKEGRALLLHLNGELRWERIQV